MKKEKVIISRVNYLHHMNGKNYTEITCRIPRIIHSLKPGSEVEISFPKHVQNNIRCMSCYTAYKCGKIAGLFCKITNYSQFSILRRR